jgi:hypothetical protein
MKFVSTLVVLVLNYLLSACTLSFTNVSTHGVADDVVDSTPTSTTDVRPNTNLHLPASL